MLFRSGLGETQAETMAFGGGPAQTGTEEFNPETTALNIRSEERRVGKECRSRWSTCQ